MKRWGFLLAALLVAGLLASPLIFGRSPLEKRISMYMERLQSGDLVERARAADALGKFGSPSAPAAPLLAILLGDGTRSEPNWCNGGKGEKRS